MKFYILLTKVLLFAFPVCAQVKLNPILELFTNTSCSVCAANNPGIYAALKDNPSVLHISYHPGSPYPNDIFYVLNKTENDARTKYYGVYGSTPKTVLNGKLIPYNSLNTELPKRYSDSSFYRVLVQFFPKGADSFTIHVFLNNLSDDTLKNAKLYSALAESDVQSTGNNGEQSHYNVFRKELNFSGTGVLTIAPGDSLFFQQTVKSDAAWNKNKIFAYAILQSALADRSVLQSARSETLNTSGLKEEKTTQLNMNPVYPNPARSVIIALQFIDSFQITDFSGRTIMRGNDIASGSELLVSHLPRGIYVMQVFSNGKYNWNTIVLE